MLEAIHIHKSYRLVGKVLHVLKGIDFKMIKGEVICIVGPSGAGKSTLLHILGGLDKPSQGKVILDEDDLYSLSDSERANVRNRKVGFIFQFYHLLPEFNVLENVMMPALISDEKRKTDKFRQRAKVLLKQVGLQDRWQHKPNQLSGGEQQRVAIARALMNEPEIIFCDEPTGNLDSQTGEGIIQLLKELNQENKQALVIVTHDDSIGKLAHRTIHLRDGKIV